jgi:hypothetical protein
MDLMTLNSDQQAYKMVERYDSLIWTERYRLGDFQITTGDVSRFMTLLPEGSLVTLRESTVPMIVERHLIERKKNAPVKLTIKGRDFCSILDRRISVIDIPGSGEWDVTTYTPQDVAFFLIDEICTGGFDPLDAFPSDLVTFHFADYETSTGPLRSFTIPRGNLLTAVLNFLQAEAKADTSTTPDTPEVVQHGIRAVRPSVGNTDIQMQIYKGVDRSDTVYFDARRQQLDDGSYLFSKEGSATTAFCIGESDTTTIEKSASPPSGMDRRVILVDGSNSNLTQDQLIENGKLSLADARETAMFDGSINPDINPYVYGVDYGLGDLVKLVGDYGLEAPKARVTEYIRSVDATGEKAYPTLATLDE